MKIFVCSFAVLVACGGTVTEESTPDAGVVCFPAIVDCRGEGAARTCSQGQVCIPLDTDER
jgi:hypothetical protein